MQGFRVQGLGFMLTATARKGVLVGCLGFRV
jgi:hypothetical protein